MDALSNDFDNIINELSSYKLGLTKITSAVNKLDKKINKIKKNNNSILEKKVTKKPSGFAKPTVISKELSTFMNKNQGEKAARTEVTQYIINYIKEKQLQNKKNKQEIILNNELSQLLDCGSKTVTYFTIQKYMNKHFIHHEI